MRLIIWSISGKFEYKGRKYKEEISANCVGYARIVREESSNSRGHHRRGLSFMTSPIFEYTYQGKEYRGIYDRMIDGLNADLNMGPVSIRIDPDHPTWAVFYQLMDLISSEQEIAPKNA